MYAITNHRRGAVLVTIALATILTLTIFFIDVAATGGDGDPTTRWLWPSTHPATINRAFDPPAQRWLPGHRGVDLDVPIGSTIHAPAAGVVIYAGQLVDRGVVSIEHPGGIRSTYEPVDSLVKVDDVVAAGDPIATVDAGHDPGTLHWGAKIGKDRYIDPLSMIFGTMALKPW